MNISRGPAWRENDFLAALRSSNVWLFLARQDIKVRYRRSKLGPFWITLSMAIFCLSLVAVYSKLFRAEIEDYLPFLASGFVIWGFLAGVVGECPNLYVDNAGYIKDIKTNLIAINMRAFIRQLIVFAHNFIIIIAAYVCFGINPGWSVLTVIPGLIIVAANILAISIPLSLIGARYRDFGPIVQSLIQILFFITPVTWFPRLIEGGSWVVTLNPFAYYLDLIRTPLLGHQPQSVSWLVAICTLGIFSSIAISMYRAKARYVPFWI